MVEESKVKKSGQANSAQRQSSDEEEIKKLNKEILDLRSELFKARDELNSIKNSRAIGKIIRVRQKLGDPRLKMGKTPLEAAVRVKRGVSRISPEFIKPPIRKHILSPIRELIKNRQNQRAGLISNKDRTVEYLANTKWTDSPYIVSVVIPYFNRESTIDDTINSLALQTLQNFEIIIVDDGSTDEASIRKLIEIKKENKKINIIHQKNQGVAAARNNGISKAVGKYIVCLDSDDMLEPTYIEKCTILLEANPGVAIVSSHRNDFGVIDESMENREYNPIELYSNNMVITAAQFRKNAWEHSGGYKSNIGYEDWEFWLSLAEHGFWGKLIPEYLFLYRVAMSSRFVQDKEAHWKNIKLIQSLHKSYVKKIERLLADSKKNYKLTTLETLFINLKQSGDYLSHNTDKPGVLITMPWMTFGGAETLIFNYTSQIKNDFTLSFMTGLKSRQEWEYKFRSVSTNIYHLANLFDSGNAYLEFISNYISTRSVRLLHIVHNSFMLELLPSIKKRHPDLKVIVTMFNDRVEHFTNSIKCKEYVDTYSSDNSKVINSFKSLGVRNSCTVIPNGVDCFETFNPALFDRDLERHTLGIEENEIAVFFVGRLSPEKNPDVFIETAKKVLKQNKSKKVKFFIIGDGPQRESVIEAVKVIGNTNLQYLGYQSEVAKYLSASDIFVLPSSIEGFPLSILEAMAMKVAVIASDVGAVSEVLQDGITGFVVRPGAVDDIYKAVTKLSSNRSLLNKIKSNSRKKVEEEYSTSILGDRYRELYRRLLK